MMTHSGRLVMRDDPLYSEAKRLILASGTPSVSLLIRSFAIGYSHATRLVHAMEHDCLRPGELDRYTVSLQQDPAAPFLLQTVAPAVG